MEKPEEMVIFGKNQNQYDFLTYFFFILMSSIILYKLIAEEFMGFLALAILTSYSYIPIYFIRFRYRRFMIFEEKEVVLKRFSKKTINIPCQQIIKFDIKLLYYSAQNIAQNLAVSGVVSLAFVPQDVEKLAETEISIWISNEKKDKYIIKLHFLSISAIDEINKLIAKKTQLKYLSYQDLKNPKRKEILWSWKLEGSDEERQETLRFLEEIPNEWKL
jgi:hypothetical protein